MPPTTTETQDNHDKIQAEIAKLIAETSQINNQNKWYVAIVTSMIILALVAVVKVFL